MELAGNPAEDSARFRIAVAYILAIVNGVWWMVIGIGTIIAALTMPGNNSTAEITLYAALPIVGFGASLGVLATAMGRLPAQAVFIAALLLSVFTVTATSAFYAIQLLMLLMVAAMSAAGG